jgi:hypothetical protein
LLFDSPIEGESRYGKYFMYGVKSDGEEFNFFAPLQVHDAIKHLQKGTEISVTKIGKQQGKKLVTDYQVEILNNGKEETKESTGNGYFKAMLQSYEEATRIQKQFSPASVSQTAITLFIAKTKTGFNNYPKE